MLPNIAVIRIQSVNWWCPPIPVPLFLIWIFAILLSPLILIGLMILWAVCLVAGLRLWRSLGVLWQILCALPGTDVRVTAEGKHITVRIL